MPSAVDSTREALLDAAQLFVQTRGYNAFSFRDLAEQVGITTASIHYHFPTKAHLGRELVIRYRQGMELVMRQIDSRADSGAERLERFISFLRGSLKDGTRMCLCGMFGAEFFTLPNDVQGEVRSMFDACEAWLAGLLDTGRGAGEFRFTGDARRAAAGVFAGLQGGMLAACALQDLSRFDATAERVMSNLSTSP